MEASVPMEVTRYGLVENSGGAGRSRGGYALVREYKILSDDAVLHVRSDRRSILPYGLGDGLPGTPSWNIINPGKNQYALPVCPMRPISLKKGDRFCHIQAGGGGYGNPLEREPNKVLDAFLNEMITEKYALEVYGVVFFENQVDEKATKILRNKMKNNFSNKMFHLINFHNSIGVEPKLINYG